MLMNKDVQGVEGEDTDDANFKSQSVRQAQDGEAGEEEDNAEDAGAEYRNVAACDRAVFATLCTPLDQDRIWWACNSPTWRSKSRSQMSLITQAALWSIVAPNAYAAVRYASSVGAKPVL